VLQSVEASAEEVARCGLQYRYHLSDNLSAPVVFLVHGRGGDSTLMWNFARAVRSIQPTIIAPQAPVADEDVGGFSWWPVRKDPSPEHRKPEQRELGVREVIHATGLLETFISRVLVEQELKPGIVVGIGFSQGAGVLSGLSLRVPALFGGIASLAGFVPRALLWGENTVDMASFARGRCPGYYFAHGTLDRVIPIDKARMCAQRLSELGARVDFVEDEVGHKVGIQGGRELASWVERFCD